MSKFTTYYQAVFDSFKHLVQETPVAFEESYEKQLELWTQEQEQEQTEQVQT